MSSPVSPGTSMQVDRYNFGGAPYDAPDFVDDLLDNLRPVVKSVWPEVSAIYMQEHADFLPIANLKPPYAVVKTGNARATGEYAIDADAYLVIVRVFYVTTDGALSQHSTMGQVGANLSIEVIRRRLGQFRRALNNTPEEIVKVVRNVGYFLDSEDIKLNHVGEEANSTLRAGYFEFVALVGESFRVTPGPDWVQPVPVTFAPLPEKNQ